MSIEQETLLDGAAKDECTTAVAVIDAMSTLLLRRAELLQQERDAFGKERHYEWVELRKDEINRVRNAYHMAAHIRMEYCRLLDKN